MNRLPLPRQLGVALGALGALGAGASGYLLRRPLPKVDGVLALGGLNAGVDVIRDRWGIPHILAATEQDAYFAQGVCHAQDRLWQMDLNRRLPRGQLSEAFGPDALDVDRFMRRLGLHRAAQAEWERLTAEQRQPLQAYTDGVNAWIDHLRQHGHLPVEYSLARFEPRRWEPLDSLSFGRYFAFTQSPNWETELMRSRLVARLGYAGAAALEPDVWTDAEAVMPRLSDWGPAGMPPVGEVPDVDLPKGPVGSNAWVVSGARSSSGKPLLANDPHLMPSLPSVFYEVHLVGGADLDVIGASAPGVPGVVIGHNRSIAWGFTASMADVQDFFVERLDPSDPSRVEHAGQWESGTLVRETIHVKGRTEPVVEEVLLTPRHGPLITPTPLLADEHRPLALKSMVLEAPTTLPSFVALNHASNWDEFRAALADWSTPGLNAVYADVDGNIGYQMIGRVPIRAAGRGLVPSPGWSGRYEWTGQVPFEAMPRAFNPPDGLWATANHNSAKGSQHFFTSEFIHDARYRRIRQALEARERHSAVDFGMLHADQVSLPAREVARLLVSHLRPTDPLERQALERLGRWDGRVEAESAAAAIYHAFRIELTRARFAGSLGDLLPAVMGVGPHPLIAPITTFYQHQTERCLAYLEGWDADPEGVSAVAARAFTAAIRDLRDRLGGDVNHWRWGQLHRLSLKHAFSARPPLGRLFDVAAFPWGGDLETVRAGGETPGTLQAGGVISGYRVIADTANWDTSLSCLPGGQSGHRGSAHYTDQLDAWRNVAYHPLSFTRPAIMQVQRHSLTLRPA